MPTKSYHNYNPREKKRHVPNWPPASEESLRLFHSHLYLADVLTQKYIKLFYFPGYGIEDIKQEILLAIYKAALYFKPEKSIKFVTYAVQGARNRLINIMRNESLRIHPQNDGDSILQAMDEGEGEALPIGRPRYSKLNSNETIFQDEKETMGEVIGALPQRDLHNLNLLCRGKTGAIRVAAAASGKSRSNIYKYYYKIGKTLEKAFQDAGMASDFKQIVDYLLTYYGPLMEDDNSEELDIKAFKKTARVENRAAGKARVEKVSVEKARKPKKQYQVISPSGELLTFTNQRQFCRENNLCYKNFSRLITGKYEQYRGYRLYKEGLSLTPFEGNKRKGREFTIVAPDGQIIRTQNMAEFARTHNLNRACISMLLHGKIKCHKGYRMMPNAIEGLIVELLSGLPEA